MSSRVAVALRREKVRELYEKGLTIRRTCDRLGVCPDTVRRDLRALGLGRQPRRRAAQSA